MRDRDRLIDDNQLTVCLFMYPPPMDTLRGTSTVVMHYIHNLGVVGGHNHTIIMYVNL